MSIKSVSNKQK